MFTRKKAQRWVLILLVCVLFIGLLPGEVLALTTEYSLYNGVLLPSIPSEWTSKHSYMIITEYVDLFGKEGYRIYMTSQIQQQYNHDKGVGVLLQGYDYATYNADLGYWYLVEDFDYNLVIIVEPMQPSYPIVWSNFDLLGSSGVVFAGTEPVEYDGSLQAHTPPTIIVNLPRNHVYSYELNEDPQQLYVDAVFRTDNSGTGIHYQWMYYNGISWVPVDFGDGNSKYYTPNTGVEGTRQYACLVSNADDIGGVSSVSSNSVYVVVGSAAEFTEPITPADQVIIDQVGQIGDKLEKLPEEIAGSVGGVMDQQQEQEKVDAADSGNASVNELLDLIPDVSGAGQSAIAPLVDACSYNGLDAVLPIPALTIPAIGDLIPEYTLLPAQEFDLASMFDLVPDAIMTVVRLLFTFALIYYLIKDTYSSIMYFFTLKEDHDYE